MNNQKDTQKTNINSYGQDSVLDVKSFTDKPIYEFANKKTEKLVSALYMVTDCMETDDALKGKLRLLGVSLLSDIYNLSTLSPMEKNSNIFVLLNHIQEILSFIEIAYTIGFISEMNTNILKNEFSGLISELKSNQTKDKHFTFTLDEKMFELSGTNSAEGISSKPFIKDIYKGQVNKKTSINSMSFMNGQSLLSLQENKRTIPRLTNTVEKLERTNRILSIIKDKIILSGNQDGISIKDISLSFVDCSEKTIQRELNMLVEKGQLRKTGAKRWSRYASIA